VIDWRLVNSKAYQQIISDRMADRITKEEAADRIEKFMTATGIKPPKQSPCLLSCGHETSCGRANAEGRKYCLVCGAYIEERVAPDRAHYHRMLDQAMDESKEGESFLPMFVALIIHELRART